MKLRNLDYLGIAGLVVGVLGVIGPIAWDHLKTKDELSVALIDQAQVIGQYQKIDGLQVSYRGNEVSELSKGTLLIENSGRTPILGRDVVSPLFIQFGKESLPIDLKVSRVEPSDLAVQLDYQKALNGAFIKFPLLNPGDRVWVSALYQAAKLNFSASGRIAGLSHITVNTNPQSLKDKSTSQTTTAIVVGFFALLMLILGSIGAKMTFDEYRFKLKVKAGTFALPTLNTRKEVVSYVTSKFDFTTIREMVPLLDKIYSFPDASGFGAAHEKEVKDGISELLRNSSTNLYYAVPILGIGIFGVWYVVQYLR